MSRLFETICIADGIPQNLYWHEQRMKRALKEIWDVGVEIKLAPEIRVPAEMLEGIIKCNIEYGPDILTIKFDYYEKRKISTLQLVTCNYADYRLKYLDRTLLNTLLQQRGECDEIIIVKEGFITDTSMSNLVFFDGSHWFTPSTPLLPGTCRERLLSSSAIIERPVRVSDLNCYSGVKLINAMRDPALEELIPITSIMMEMKNPNRDKPKSLFL